MNAEARAVLVSVLLMMGALCIYFVVGLGQPGSWSQPANIALPEDGQWAQSGPFYSGIAGSFRASLVLQRRHPFKEMECLADVGTAFPQRSESGRRADCPSGFAPAIIDWAVLENGRPMPLSYDFGEHAGEYSSAEAGRSLGIFRLRYFTPYVLRARLVVRNSALAELHPRIRLVYEGGSFPEDFLFRTLAFSLLAVGLVAASLVILTRSLWRSFRARSQ